MNILLSGISKGLGFSIAKSFLKTNDNAVIYGICRTVNDTLLQLAHEYSGRIKIIEYDLSASRNIEDSLFKDNLHDVELHAFVNNAAVAYDDIITNANHDKLLEMYNTNVISPIMITKKFIRNLLLHNNKGNIIHISSISAHTGYKGLSMYASTKGALEAFSKNTAREWGEIGVRSNCIVCGFMETDMSASLSKEQKDRIYKRNSLKQAVDINSVASTVCFLTSNAAKSITGQNIFIDNGTI